MSATQEAFIAAYLRGDPEEVAQIDRWIEKAARSYARRLGDHWEDVLQDIRLEVFRLLQKGQFRGEARLKTYLWRVVAHSCLDRIRQGERWQWTDLDGAPELETVTRHREHKADPSNETIDLITRVLERTSEECRRLWQMILDGRSYREMSRIEGASEGTLRVRVLRCRKKATEIRDLLLGQADI